MLSAYVYIASLDEYFLTLLLAPHFSNLNDTTRVVIVERQFKQNVVGGIHCGVHNGSSPLLRRAGSEACSLSCRAGH